MFIYDPSLFSATPDAFTGYVNSLESLRVPNNDNLPFTSNIGLYNYL